MVKLDDYVFERLAERNLLYRTEDEITLCGLAERAKGCSDFAPVMRSLERGELREYRKNVRTNALIFYLFAESAKKRVSCRAACCAAAYIAVSCYIDDMLDGNSEDKKAYALALLDENGLLVKVLSGAAADAKDSLWELIAEIGAYLRTIKIKNPEGCERLFDDLRKCLDAERTSVCGNGAAGRREIAFLFETTAFRMALGGSLTADEERLCTAVSEAKCIMDDLTDLTDDMKSNQPNLILSDAKESVCSAADRAFCRLDTLLDEIKQGASCEFYTVFIMQLRIWTLENSRFRELMRCGSLY